MTIKSYDIVIVGAGPAGLLAGLTLGHAGFNVAICGKLPKLAKESLDTRTAALFNDSIVMLDNLGIWSDLNNYCARIDAIRIVDDMKHLLRGPEMVFNANLLGLQALGWNVPNSKLVEHLSIANSNLDCCQLVLGTNVVSTKVENEEVIVKDSTGSTLRAKLLIAADGQHSIVRETTGLKAHKISYMQSALTTIFQHSRPHYNISSEFHRPGGPLTVVPLPGNKSSLVWVDTIGAIRKALLLNDDAFVAQLEKQLHGVLGGIKNLEVRHQFSLATLTANKLISNRTALIGEAGHAFPPIGAQGLNLSFRDVAILTEVLTHAGESGLDIGASGTLQQYQDHRAFDIRAKSFINKYLARFTHHTKRSFLFCRECAFT